MNDAMIDGPDRSPQPNAGSDALLAYGWRFWAAVLVTGVGAGLGAGLLMKLLHLAQSLAWGEGSGDFLDAVMRADPWRRVGVLLAAGAVVGATRLLLRLRGSGHGGALDEALWFHAGHLPVFRTLLNAVTSIVIVGMGASLGREAAPKQTGAVLGSALGRWIGLSPTQRRLLVACGAGGGIAAVYNVPIGAALFAMEVLLGSLSLSLAPPALAATALATATAWLLLPDRATYDVPSYPSSPALLAGALVLGPLAGLAAAGYVKLICWADAKKPSGWAVAAAPVLVFGLLGAASTWMPQLLGNGKDTVQAAFTDQGLSTLFLLVFVIGKPLATAACLGAGAPGGLFTPTITTGAALGLLFGHIVALIAPDTVPPAIFAIVGAGAVLAATTQGPLSALVLLAELTWRIDPVLVAIGLAIPGALLVARRLDARSVYAGRIHIGRAKAEPDATVISSAAHVREALEAFLEGKAVCLTVVDESGQTLGLLRPDDVRAARSRCAPFDIATVRDLLPDQSGKASV